jgi:hypothetical protein
VDDKTYRIFLSHSSSDAECAKWIAATTQAVGIEVYLYEHDSQPGRLVAHKLKTAIQACDAFVVLLTSNSQFSPYVHQEIGAAKALNKPVIPLVQPGGSERGLAMLEGVEYIHFDLGDRQRGMSTLLDHLQKAKRNKEMRQPVESRQARNAVSKADPMITVRTQTAHQIVNVVGPTVIKTTRASVKRLPIPGTVGADPYMKGGLQGLIKKLGDFRCWEKGKDKARSIFPAIYDKFLKDFGFSVFDTPSECFPKAVAYLQAKIDNTKLGRINRGKGKPSY